MTDADGGIESDRSTVGLLGDASSLRASFGELRFLEGATAVADGDPDAILAVGAAGLGELLDLDTTAPTLPVNVEPNGISIDREHVRDTLEETLAGDAEYVERPVLAASIDGGGSARALFDVTLVSDQPARISAFSVSRGETTVFETRADGVVVATPAGSHGYARAAGGVRIATGTDALAIVPISAFAGADQRWITPIESLTVSVEREETPIAVRADDRRLETVPSGTAVEIAPAGTITTVVPPGAEPNGGG